MPYQKYHTDEIHEILRNLWEGHITDHEAHSLLKEVEHERLNNFILEKFNQGFFTELLSSIPRK